jgi:Na+(H+)/acetate symporter ActP
MENNLESALEYLDKIARKLGISVEKLWPYFIREEIVQSITSVVVLIAFCIPFYYTMLMVLNCKWEGMNSTTDEKPEQAVKEVLLIVAAIILAIFVFFSAINFLFNFFDIFNPTYSAIERIVNIARKFI